MTERLTALKDADHSSEFWGNNQPKCPHCGNDFDIEYNEAWHLYEEGDHEVECNSCDLMFSVAVRVTFSFSTDEQEEDDDE